jgi:FdhD protein
MVMKRYPALRVQDGKATRFLDPVIHERRYHLYLNNEHITTIVASPDQLAELGAGFVICEGLADRVSSVSVENDDIRVEAEVRNMAALEFRSCGGCGIMLPPKTVKSGLEISPETVYAVTREITSETWRQTGGVHCSVLFSEGGLIAKSCDIGRHNTVDKVVGYAELKGIDRSACILGCTGRQPAGMITKSANAGIPIVISRAASTDRGIAAAGEAGITLVCFSRENRFTIYTHPERIGGLDAVPQE